MSYVTIDQVTSLTGQVYFDNLYQLTGITGAFVVGETITGGTSGDTSIVSVVGVGYLEAVTQSPISEIGLEAITGSTSGATATVSKVKAHTKPSREAVSSLIDDVDGEINNILSANGGDVPVITDADRLTYLKNGARFGVASMIEAQNYVQTKDNESSRGSEWARNWRSFRKELRNRPEFVTEQSRIAYSFPTVTEYDIGDIS